MKIGIVTVFKSLNCGSFLQAWALKETLSSKDNDVFFCDYKKDTGYSTFVAFLQCCVRLRFKRAFGILKKLTEFKKLQASLDVKKDAETADMLVFGSDTLWNFNDKFFSDNAGFFTGGGTDKPCYTYSMSVGSTCRDVLLKKTEAVKNIQKFKRIAVRDNYTQEVISKIYDAEKMIRTIDPTMLLDKETYLKHFKSDKLCLKKTLAIYHFGVINDNLWQALKKFAERKGLTIINIGTHGDCDAPSVTPYPSSFISILSNAEYIFTNTFHGCVFSALFNKQFATDGISKKKIEGFLQEFALTDRVANTADDIEKVFETSVDYDKVNMLIAEGRKRSVEYLEGVIKEAGKNE